MKKASEQRKHDCLRELFNLLANCHNDKEEVVDKIRYYLLGLWMDPWSKDAWIGLAEAYDEKLHTSQTHGIQLHTTLEYSGEAQQVLCNCLQAYSAVLAVAKDDAAVKQVALRRLGVTLYLFIQGTKSSLNPFPTDFFQLVCVKACELFAQAHDAQDWTVEYYQGKLARKLALSEIRDAERVQMLKKSLEHLFKAASQNKDADTSTLCIEPLYKLHSTRAKILLGAVCDEQLLVELQSYALANCVERARQGKSLF